MDTNKRPAATFEKKQLIRLTNREYKVKTKDIVPTIAKIIYANKVNALMSAITIKIIVGAGF